MRGLGEGGVGLLLVAELVEEGAVAAELGPDQRRALVERRRRLGRGLLGIVVDLDQLGGVLRQRAAVGDDEGDGVADMVDAVAAQDRDVARRRAGAVRLLLHDAGAQIAEMRKIGAGQHQMHARRLFGRFGRADREAAPWRPASAARSRAAGRSGAISSV